MFVSETSLCYIREYLFKSFNILIICLFVSYKDSNSLNKGKKRLNQIMRYMDALRLNLQVD